MKTGLVLGAGGIAGVAFHRGVIRAMGDVGLEPESADIVVGTSAGSWVAANLRRRAGAPPGIAEQRTGRLLPERHELLRLLRSPRQRINAALLWPEFANGHRDVTFIREGLRDAGPDWPPAPLWIVAVRRSDGRRVVFGKPGEPTTDVGSAVAASCAIPGYFKSVEIDGITYVDGGVHSPTNVDLLAEWQLDLVVVSSPMSYDPEATRVRLDLPIRAWFRQLLREEVWALRQRRLHVITIEPDREVLHAMGLNMMRGHRVDEIEQLAHTHATRRLRAALAERPPQAA